MCFVVLEVVVIAEDAGLRVTIPTKIDSETFIRNEGEPDNVNRLISNFLNGVDKNIAADVQAEDLHSTAAPKV